MHPTTPDGATCMMPDTTVALLLSSPQTDRPFTCSSLSSENLKDEDNYQGGKGHRPKHLRAIGLQSPAVETAEFLRYVWEAFRLSKGKTQLGCACTGVCVGGGAWSSTPQLSH